MPVAFTEIGPETYSITKCCVCDVRFAMTADFERRRREDRRSFYCPNGHAQGFCGKTPAEREREAREAAERRAVALQAQIDQKNKSIEHLGRRLNASRGVTTRLKNRIKNGVCPCCNRHFKDLHRHMTTEHPDFRPDAVD